jgi:CheY-like chemotaxis protein
LSDYETSYLRKDGLRLNVHVSITPLRNIAGKVVGYLHVAHDITPRKLLEAELRNKVDTLQSGEQPSAPDHAHKVSELPEWLRAEGASNAEQLSWKLHVLNNWYESEGPIPDLQRDESSSTPRILIVDDFEATRFLLRAYLQEEGYLLDFAGNGKEALEQVAANSYRLILMDVEMPEMGGYEAASRIRDWEKSQGRPPVPIVALTAHNQRSGDKAGIWTSYVQKPVSKVQLLERVKEQVETKVVQSFSG